MIRNTLGRRISLQFPHPFIGFDPNIMLRARARPEAANEAQISSRSFSFAAETGNDGKVVYRNRKFAASNGIVNEEFAETFDGKNLERSLTRKMGDRSISSRTLHPEGGAAPETRLEMSGLEGDEALAKFETEWTNSAAGLPDIAADADFEFGFG